MVQVPCVQRYVASHARAGAAVCIVLAMSAVIAACGDDSKEPISTGLEEDQRLSSFDDADAVEACKGLARSSEHALPKAELRRSACVLLGIEDAIAVAAAGDHERAISECEMRVTACEAGGSDAGVEVDDRGVGWKSEAECEDAKVDAELRACDATVGEYDGCINGYLAALETQLRGVRCELLSDPEALEHLQVSVNLERVPACRAIYTKCPGLNPFGAGAAGDETEGPEPSST